MTAEVIQETRALNAEDFVTPSNGEYMLNQKARRLFLYIHYRNVIRKNNSEGSWYSANPAYIKRAEGITREIGEDLKIIGLPFEQIENTAKIISNLTEIEPHQTGKYLRPNVHDDNLKL